MDTKSLWKKYNAIAEFVDDYYVENRVLVLRIINRVFKRTNKRFLSLMDFKNISENSFPPISKRCATEVKYMAKEIRLDWESDIIRKKFIKLLSSVLSKKCNITLHSKEVDGTILYSMYNKKRQPKRNNLDDLREIYDLSR